MERCLEVGRSRRCTALGVCWVIVACVVFALALTIGCSDSPTASWPPEWAGHQFLLSRLSVAVVPGGSETIEIRAMDAKEDSYTVTNDSPGVVAVELSGSQIEVTGLAYGNATITVKNSLGAVRTLPVQVYNYQLLDLGDIYATYTDTFEYVHFYSLRPVPPEGFHAVATSYIYNYYPDGQLASLVLQAKPGSDALVYTDSFVGMGYPYLAGWTPIPPDGYVALGQTITNTGWDPPDSAVCVRADLTTIGVSSEHLVTLDIVSPADYYLSYWKIDQPDAGPHPGAFLTANSFIAHVGTSTPTNHPAAHVLDVELPLLAEAPYQEFVPTLDGYDTPPDETEPMMAKAMLVPCTIVHDELYQNDIGWQIANSPFYRLEREVFYKRIYHNLNQTSEVQTNSVVIRSGITTTESERVWNETQISVSVEAGLCFKAFTGKVTATVSRKFGYETQTSISELTEKEVSTSINTSPGKAAALWQKFNRFVLYRHNGTDLEPVTTWEFGIDSYVTDEYPN